MKLESKLVCLVALLMLPIGTAAYADETFEIVHIKCSPTTNTIQITPFFAYNIDAPANNENNDIEWRAVAEKKVLRRGDSTFYLGEGVIRAKCKLAGNDIAINIKYNKPSARGQCGGNPIGFLNVTENGASLIKGEVIHDCMKLQQTAFLFDRERGWRRCVLSERTFNAENDPKRSCASLSVSQEQEYPPYPDPWDWARPGGKESVQVVLGVEIKPNGDVLITYGDKGMTFFSRQISSPSVSQKANHGQATIKLKSGDIIQRAGVLGGRSGGCYNGLDAVITRKDKSWNDTARKRLLYMYQHPQRYITRNECLDGPPFVNRVDSVFADFLALEDGTFLLLDHQHGLIVRFDSAFNTHSSLINNRLFLIDEENFASDRSYGDRETGTLNLQIEQDQLYKQLMEIKKGNAK